MRRLLIIALVSHLAMALKANADATAIASGIWSNPATWGGVPPGPEVDVTIPAGITVILDMDAECGQIMVDGILEVERADRSLICDAILVQGSGAEFRAGTAADRFLQNFTLTLKGLATEPVMTSMGSKILGAHNGGTLNIHGRNRVEWTKLGLNAPVGATSMTLSEPVDWVAGDLILVTSSRLSWSEAETRTISSVTGNTISFEPPLAFPHNGSTTTRTRATDGKTWAADLRAEVGLLSRNVRIQGDESSDANGFGGHIMVMNGGAGCCTTSGRAFIQGIELYRMGQKSMPGRYPMHWHMCAEGGAGQYFKDSVVRKSYNRAITIHGTESTLVDNNFCHDHPGHGIFLEDGSERFNVITRNVVLSSMRPPAGEEILQTDNLFNTVQNRSPASFWITNPNNVFTDNIAAGTHGTGFWFAFPKKPLNASATHPRFSTMEPYKQPLGLFDRNTAHSCASGLDINDQVDADDNLVINGEWANNGPFYFNECTWYSNSVAIYAGIGGTRRNVVYSNHVFSDNETNLFLATYHLCEQSLMIADSGFGILPSNKTRTVYAVYDGAGHMKDNHLVGYHAGNAKLFDNIGAATKHPNHRFEGFTFDPPVTPRSSLTNYHIVPPADVGANSAGHPRIWAQVVHDVDGSISGVPDSSLVSNQPFMLTGTETRPPAWTNMYRSSHRFAQVRMTYGLPSTENPNVSVRRSKPGTPDAGVYYINGYKEQHQLPLIVRGDFLYTYEYESLPSTRKVVMTMNDATAGDHVVVCFKNFGKLPGIAVSGMSARASLTALKAGTTSGFFRETDGDFYVRPTAASASQTFTLTWTSQMTLPAVDSDGDGTSDGDEAAAGRDPFHGPDATNPFVNSDFNIPGNCHHWASFSGITAATVASGVLSGRSTNTDPQFAEANLRLSGNDNRWLLVRMKASQSTSAQILWTRVNGSSFTTARSISTSHAGGGAFKVLAFPMHTKTEWQGQIITSLRVDPTSASGVDFEIDWIRSSNGDLDGDGLSDAFEGDADFDEDGLVNLEDTDSDGDALADAIESAAGLDPLNPLDLNSGFNTADDFEGWHNRQGFVAEPVPSVSGGTMKGTSNSNADPYFWKNGFSLRGSAVNQVVVKIKTTTSSGSIELFWHRPSDSGFHSSRRVSTSSGPANVWRIAFLNVANHSSWVGHTISSIRIDPVTVANKNFEIDWIRVSSGDLDGDGINDSDEGSGDLDGDGLFNLEDLDSDADGIPDASDPQPYVNGVVDSDNDGLPDATDPDDDNDGIPDVLETELGLSSTVPIDPVSDSDGDGQTDLLEIHAGSNHLNPANRFNWSVSMQPGQMAKVVIPVRSGRTYRLLAIDDFMTGTWQEIEIITPTGDGVHEFVEAAVYPKRFYKVGIRLHMP